MKTKGVYQEPQWPMLLVLSCATIVFIMLIAILGIVFFKGLPAITFEFLTSFPTHGMTQGGILPAIVGTVMLTLITAVFSIPLGVGCAVYLNEYAQNTRTTRLIRAAIRNLAGVPSIIFGLFGLALFVEALDFGTSLYAAGFTLGLLSLPYTITTTEEALKVIPEGLREGALALGATKYESIRDVVIPAAVPGIATGAVLSLSRAAGETAPILFTGAVFYITGLPGHPGEEFMALPYHLYILSTQHQSIEAVRPLAFGTAVVLVVLVFLMNLAAIILRNKFRNKLK